MDKSERFEQLVNALRLGDGPVRRLRLDRLSDLDAARLARLEAAWPTIPPCRRRDLMCELGRLAKDQIELSFEAISRMVLQDPDEEVRRSAIDNLWECEDAALVEPLIHALKHDMSSSVRACAAVALGRFVLLGQMDQIGPGLLAAAEDSLLEAYRSEAQTEVRQRALESLGFSSREEVDGLIQEAYNTANETMVGSALLAMGRTADPRWHPQVHAGLRGRAPTIRREAARAAGELELRAAIPDLIDLLEDVDRGVRRAAIWSLGELGGAQAQEALVGLLDSGEDQEEASLLEDALDNLAFVNGTRDFLLYDFDESEDEAS